MLKVFYGSDVIGVREAASLYVSGLREKDSSLEVERLEAENYEPGQLASFSEAVSLFGGSRVYLIDTPSGEVNFLAEVMAELETLVSSTHTFLWLEGSILAPERKKITKYTDNMIENKAEAKTKVDAFQLADALARKDKKLLWILLQEAVRVGMSAEEIVGILWWQLKTLRLAGLTKSASEAGVKDFPYNKAKKALVNFKTGEVETFSLALLQVYHDGHAGKRDIDLALEEWVLSL